MRWTRSARRAAALTILLAFAACGGGGALPTEADLGGESGGTGTDGGADDGGSVGGGEAPAPVTVTVIIGESGFQPGTVTIPAGSTVVWQVIDNHHDVTFVGDAPAGGHVGDTDEGESASRTFDRTGTYDYYCDRHDGEEMGSVVVTSSVAGGDGGGGGDPTEPAAAAIVRTPGDSFSPATVTIATGGTVQWQISGDDHNVTFTGAAPPGGNIPTTGGATVSRTFPAAGRFDYFCTRHAGMNGAVVVQ